MAVTKGGLGCLFKGQLSNLTQYIVQRVMFTGDAPAVVFFSNKQPCYILAD